jgi:hypothetical protein
MYKKSFLPPDVQPWRRSIETAIDDTFYLDRINVLNNKNELSQINSTVSFLNRSKNFLQNQLNQTQQQQIILQNQQDFLESFQTISSSNPNVISSTSANNEQFEIGDVYTDFMSFTRDTTLLINSYSSVTCSVTSFYSSTLGGPRAKYIVTNDLQGIGLNLPVNLSVLGADFRVSNLGVDGNPATNYNASQLIYNRKIELFHTAIVTIPAGLEIAFRGSTGGLVTANSALTTCSNRFLTVSVIG